MLLYLALFAGVASAASYSCPELSCSVECLNPAKDDYGCPTCECDFCDASTAKLCGLSCENGYELFEATYGGQPTSLYCPMCKCAEATVTDTDVNATAYDVDVSDYDEVSAQEMELNLKKAMRAKNLFNRKIEDGTIDLEEISKSVEERKKDAKEHLSDSTMSKVERIQDRHQNSPPIALFAVKRYQTKEALNRTTEEVNTFVNDTLHTYEKQIKRHIQNDAKTPIYNGYLAFNSALDSASDSVNQWRHDTIAGAVGFRQDRRQTRRDFIHGAAQNVFEAITDAIIDNIDDDQKAKAAKEAREDFEDEDHYGMFLYRQYVKFLYSEEDDHILTDSERAALKRFIIQEKQYLNNNGIDKEVVAEKANEVYEKALEQFIFMLEDELEAINKKYGTHFKLDPKFEEYLEYRHDSITRHPGRAIYIAKDSAFDRDDVSTFRGQDEEANNKNNQWNGRL
jgi:hypothetical protein